MILPNLVYGNLPIMPRSNEVRGKVSNFEEQTIKRMKLFTEENVTSESKISIIPVEVLIQIFESLSMKDIENCSNTCVEWRRICLFFIFRPYIKRFAMKHNIQDTLIANGWTDNIQDFDLIRDLYEVIKSYKVKVLVYNGQATEIIDLKIPELRHFGACKSPDYIPLRATRGFCGTHLEGKPLIFGGIDYETRKHYVLQDYCIIGHTNQMLKMIEKRFYAACVSLDQQQDSTIWIVGGKNRRLGRGGLRNNARYEDEHLKSTEIISLRKPPILGPVLPFSISYHGIVKCYKNDDIYLIGGEQNGCLSDKTWIVNIMDPKSGSGFRIKEGPTLLQKRSGFSCGQMKIKGKHILVVVGGYGEKNNALFSVELLDPSSDKGWVKGPRLPIKLAETAMLTSPSGDGVIVIGGYNSDTEENSRAIYELKGQTKKWTILKQSLEHTPNGAGLIAIPISEEFIT